MELASICSPKTFALFRFASVLQVICGALWFDNILRSFSIHFYFLLSVISSSSGCLACAHFFWHRCCRYSFTRRGLIACVCFLYLSCCLYFCQSSSLFRFRPYIFVADLMHFSYFLLLFCLIACASFLFYSLFVWIWLTNMPCICFGIVVESQRIRNIYIYIHTHSTD